MALEFAIFRVEADACTWQESSRNLAAAKARAELLGAVASSLVYKRASRKAQRASALLLLCFLPEQSLSSKLRCARLAGAPSQMHL